MSEWNREGYEAVYVYLACLSDALLPQVTRVPFDVDMIEVLGAILRPYEGEKLPIPAGELTREWEATVWPVKKIPQAETRVNCFARELLSCSSISRERWSRIMPVGLTNDQACAAIIWAEAASRSLYSDELMSRVLGDLANGCKQLSHLSDRFKMLGLASSRVARLVIESKTLLGRGVGDMDGAADLAKRTDMSVADQYLAKVPLHRLRNAIRRIYSEEIGSYRPTVRARDHLLDRAIWSRAGGHSAKWWRYSSNVRHIDGVRNRAQYLMRVSVDELLAAKPEVTITQVAKLEHGKTRWIYSCDSVSYALTECLLSPVESAWRNYSVLLDPDIGGPLVESTLCPGRDAVCVMLDYSDFNSQHSLDAMCAVFEELKEFTSGDGPSLCDWVAASLRNMNIAGTAWVAGLPSGHRATTFINSVLNKAYCMSCLPKVPATSLHAGDDVLLVYHERVRPSDFLFTEAVFNRSKQSYGPRAEFLRKHHTGRASFGYPCRAISSLVSGSWVSDAIRENVDTLRPLLQGIDTIENRVGLYCSVAHLFLGQLKREYHLTEFEAQVCAARRVAYAGAVLRGPALCKLQVEEKLRIESPPTDTPVAVWDAVSRRNNVFSHEERRYAWDLLRRRAGQSESSGRPTLSVTPVRSREYGFAIARPRHRVYTRRGVGADGFVSMVKSAVYGRRCRSMLRDAEIFEPQMSQVIADLGYPSVLCSNESFGKTATFVTPVVPMYV